jgi:hypothetical protein
MASIDPDERPAKKPRFFVENSPSAKQPLTNLGVPRSISPQIQVPTEPTSSRNAHCKEKAADFFDVEAILAFVGHAIPDHIIDQLREQSGGNVERGWLTCMPFICPDPWLIIQSNKPLSRRLMDIQGSGPGQTCRYSHSDHFHQASSFPPHNTTPPLVIQTIHRSIRGDCMGHAQWAWTSDVW